MNIEEMKKQFETLKKFQYELLLKKGHDYSGTSDTLNNFKVAGNICGRSPEENCLHLIATEVARLGNLFSSNLTPRNEAIPDSVIDLNNYSALLFFILSENLNKDSEQVEIDYIISKK